MIRAGPRNRRRRLDDVQTVHLAASVTGVGKLIELAVAVKVLHVPDVPGSAGEKIGVERQNDFRLFQPVHGADVTAKGQLGAFAHAVAAGGLPPMPFPPRPKLPQAFQLLADAWRSNRSRENAQPRAVPGPDVP